MDINQTIKYQQINKLNKDLWEKSWYIDTTNFYI